MPRDLAEQLISQLRVQLDLLHAAGDSHGLLAPANILVDAEGQPTLINARQPGDPVPHRLAGYLPQDGTTGREADLYGLNRLASELLGHTLAEAPAAPPAEGVSEMEALLERMNTELAALPDPGRTMIPLAGILLSAVLWRYFNWLSLTAIPAALMLRMMRGDLKQKRLFLGPMLAEIGRFCEQRVVPREFLWHHVLADPERYSPLSVWMQYAEDFFLPEELRAPPRRMGGVSKVPWS